VISKLPTPAAPFEIALLADHPEAIPIIEAGYKAEWDFWYGPRGQGDARTDLWKRSNVGTLPLGLVAKRAGAFVGAIALQAHAIPTRPNLNPCLGGLWVAQAHRNCGIGSALLAASVAKAAEMGFARVYSATANARGLFQHAGWNEIEKTMHEGGTLWIYAIDCAQRPGKARP